MSRLIIPTGELDPEGLLRNWQWLVPIGYRTLFASAFGDLFLSDERGRMFWLNVGGAELVEVAENASAFEQMLTEPEHRDFYLGPHLVEACEAAGLQREPDECYSYLTLPMLGGAYKPSNFRGRTLEGHLAGWGPICEQLAELPDGAEITFKVVP